MKNEIRKAARNTTRSLTSSPLGRAQPIPMDIEFVKRQGWRDQKILVINERDERLDFVEREFIRRIGERLYGPKPRPRPQYDATAGTPGDNSHD